MSKKYATEGLKGDYSWASQTTVERSSLREHPLEERCNTWFNVNGCSIRLMAFYVKISPWKQAIYFHLFNVVSFAYCCFLSSNVNMDWTFCHQPSGTGVFRPTLDTKVTWCLGVFRGALICASMMPRDASLSRLIVVIFPVWPSIILQWNEIR